MAIVNVCCAGTESQLPQVYGPVGRALAAAVPVVAGSVPAAAEAVGVLVADEQLAPTMAATVIKASIDLVTMLSS
jgi:hypothetical protein